MKGLRRALIAVAVAIAVAWAPSVAGAETYPDRPVRLIMPSAPGGGPDVAARVIAQKLSDIFGKQFFVENIPGGGQNTGMSAAARAKPDGHTILVGMSTFIVNPMIYAKAPFDPIKDFTPVTLLGVSHFVLAVHPSVPANNARELIDLIKANPGKYNFTSPGFGTTPHLLGELLRLRFDLDFVHVPFNGGALAAQATVAGTTQVYFAPVSLAVPQVKEGRLRALAVTTRTRLSDLPDVPTAAEAGLPGEGADTIVGVLAPAGTPKTIVDLLHREIVKVTAMPDVSGRFAAIGLERVGSTPAEFAAYIESETARWRKVIRDANIRVQ